MGLSSAERSYSSAQFCTVVEQMLQTLAATGAGVIVGHAAQMALQDRPTVLKVFLHAPMADRLRRLERLYALKRYVGPLYSAECCNFIEVLV